MTTTIDHENILDSYTIKEFLDEYADMTAIVDDPDETPEAIADAQDWLDDVDEDEVASLREMLKFSEDYSIDSFINESYWSAYAEQDYVDIYGDVPYVDYDSYADDLLSEYTEFTFDGTEYYARSY